MTMRYRPLGKTGLDVSELSFGAARGADDDPDGFIRVVHAAIDAGINFIDTASQYGESERVLGEALVGHDDVLVETKYLPYENFSADAKYVGSPEALVASAEESMRRLKRDRLDVLLAHGIRTAESLEQFLTDGSMEALIKLRDDGKVRFIGISELSEADGTHAILRQLIPSGTLDVVMLTVNFMLQTAIDSVLPLCERHGVGTVVMMPLNQASKESGLVSKAAALECVRRHIAAGNLPDDEPYTRDDLFDFLDPYSVPEAALRFVLAQRIDTCCVGVRSVERLEQNMRAVDPPYLDAERMRKLTQLFSRIESQER